MKQVLLTFALLAGGAALAQTTPAPTPAPATTAAAPARDPQTVVARIGTQTLTLADFESAYRQAVAQVVNAQGVPLSADVLPYFVQYRPEILEQVARQRAVLQLAANSGLKVDTAKVDQSIEDLRKEYPADADYTDALEGSGYVSEAALRQSIADAQLYRAYLDTIRGKFKFSDSVVNGYYLSHKADFTRPAEACAKHILLKDDATARTVAARLSKGEDFAKVAAEVSEDPGSKGQGGDLGCLAPGDTVPEFDAAVFKGPLNTVQTVKTQFGTHLVVVTKRTDAGLAPLAEAADQIRDTLANEAAQKYINAQLVKVKVEVFKDLVTEAAPKE
ncbi:peptidylprolyl isomerase [Deinococcus maricopensis]|uniref:PpiC-type peptidyl-prolyl cis-trans isomerase n=1 Tax=Deinococcus maricopensis (strain DSM 21211 / LMG 22137 / NRRL B-23946 / LB-34) TaxID=709986 RepID=E8U819_DEIML|nr:peptidylprolyl isomerase [Deinococcus maricopensis]ADV67208.1 PpiC-type peptidyl-prolyl cis-trans isomerase [Deinococcus maricopensis DSM 21211]